MTPSPLTPAQRQRGMLAAFGCTAAAALGLGGLLPLLSITMERMGVPSTLIGLNAAMPFLSALLLMPFVPKLMAKMNTTYLLAGSAVLSALITFSYGLYVDVNFWFFMRFINGAGLGVLFVISEAWINHYAPEKTRGRVIGIYVTILGGCFALGPVILLITGTSGLLPFAFCAGLIVLASLPLLGALNLPDAFDEEERSGDFFKFFSLAPTLALAGVIYGAIEAVVITFFPVYSLRLGLSEQLAAITLTAFSLGNLTCQIPLGMIADVYGRRLILALCSMTAASVMIVMAVFFASNPVINNFTLAIFSVCLFIFGGTAVGIYTMAMAEMGERFRGAALAAVNAALVFCYNLGGVSAPVVTGVVMDGAPYVGLPLLLAALCGSVLIPTLWRRLKS